MRIFVAGASGVIGRELLPMLAGHDVVGMTRSQPDVVQRLGAAPVVVDVYDQAAVLDGLRAARPDVVVDLLTDLAGRDFAANNRIRLEGTPNLVAASVAAGARRLVVESVAFELAPEAADALATMERVVRQSGLETRIIRLGRLWGLGTWADAPGPGAEDEYVHVREAAGLFRDAILEP